MMAQADSRMAAQHTTHEKGEPQHQCDVIQTEKTKQVLSGSDKYIEH